MSPINFSKLCEGLVGRTVQRPNQASAGTLSGHAAGEPFEKLVYHVLKNDFPGQLFKQFEYLNDLYLRHPTEITLEAKQRLIQSPTVLFLITRGDASTQKWSPDNLFAEKQNDTADMLFNEGDYFDLIDVKTRNVGKNAQPPNIISARKLAGMCARMIDNQDFDVLDIDYVEVDWQEDGDELRCVNAHHANLFKIPPATLYINWTAATQLQFHVADARQDWAETKEQWARRFISHFVYSAKERCKAMLTDFVVPYLKYLSEEERAAIFTDKESPSRICFELPH